MKVWWLSYYIAPETCHHPRTKAKWPDDVQGWQSGTRLGPEAGTWCFRVEAATAMAAMAKVHACYGVTTGMEMRWEPEEKPAGWQPPADRFPQ